MSTTLDDPTVLATETQQATAAQRLRGETTAARISFQWLGTRKTLSTDQKARAADTFGAEHESLSASKRLLDASHPAFKAVTAVKSRNPLASRHHPGQAASSQLVADLSAAARRCLSTRSQIAGNSSLRQHARWTTFMASILAFPTANGHQSQS
jgi:hypothetical protein